MSPSNVSAIRQQVLSPKRIRKILLWRISSLGDIVMTTAMIRCVRQAFPTAQIDMWVGKEFLPLLTNCPHLDGVYGLDRKAGLRELQGVGKQLKQEKYDLIYDAHVSLRSRFLLPQIPAPHRARFQKNYFKRNFSLLFKVNLIHNHPRFLNRFIEPLHRFGVKWDGRGPELFFDRQRGKAKLESLGVDLLSPPVGVIPSAQWPGKRWPLDSFKALLGRLVQTTSKSILVFGGPEDHFCEALTEGLHRGRVFNLQGKLSLKEVGEVLGHCSSVVSNDTGLLHMADALGVPSVVIMGPTSTDLGCKPFHPLTQVVEKKLWCRPCSKNGEALCIRGRRVCLSGISVGQVHEAFTHLEAQVEHARSLQ